jgi:hypothetical protein
MKLIKQRVNKGSSLELLMDEWMNELLVTQVPSQ